MNELIKAEALDNRRTEFANFIDQALQCDWKRALAEGQRAYNLKLYNIGGLSPKKVRELYLHIMDTTPNKLKGRQGPVNQNEVWR